MTFRLVTIHMSLKMRIIGKLFLAIALIVVPFSMPHASMVDVIVKAETEHVMHDHQHMIRDADHRMDQHSSVLPPHEGHDDANCCSSICGGALTVDTHQTKCSGFSKLNHVFGSKPLEPGELVPPFRPPST